MIKMKNGQVTILKFVKPQPPTPPQAQERQQEPAREDARADARAAARADAKARANDERRQTRRNQHLALQLKDVENRLEGLRSLVFYTLFEYDAPEGAEPGVDAAIAEILAAMDAAAAGVDLLRRGLTNHRDPSRHGTPPRGIVPAVEGSPHVPTEELEEPE